MNYSLEEYASRNELNKIIARNMIYITQLQEGYESFKNKAVHCFSHAYSICRDIIEQSPVSIYRVPDYYRMASYPYSNNEDQKMVMKAVTISIVLILLAHFDEKWREDNQEFIGTLNGPLWKMRLSSEKRNMFDMKLQRVMAFNPICGGIYNSLCSGTDIDYIIPFDEFDPRKEVIAQKEKTEQIAVEASSENSKKLEMQNTRIEQLKKEIEELKEENETLGLAIEGYKSQGKGISAPEAAMLVTAVCDALNQLPANGRETLWPILSTCWGFTEKTAKDALRRKVTEEKASKLAGKFAVHNLVPRICNLLKELHEKLAEKKKERLLEVNPKVKK